MTPSDEQAHSANLEKQAEEYAKHFASPAIAYGADILRAFLAGARSRDAEVEELKKERDEFRKIAQHHVDENQELSVEIAELMGAIGSLQIRLSGVELDCENAWGMNTLLRSRLARALRGEREYKRLAESWMKDYDKLKAKYEPMIVVLSESDKQRRKAQRGGG